MALSKVNQATIEGDHAIEAQLRPRFERANERALDANAAFVLRKVRGLSGGALVAAEPGEPGFWTLPDEGDIFDRERFAQDLDRANASLRREGIAIMAGGFQRLLGITMSLDSPILAGVFEQIPNRTADIVQLTWERIQLSLRDSYQLGRSITQATDDLRSVFAVNKHRAAVIARTELAMVKNAGSMQGAALAGAERKRWIATRDDRTRPAHVAAHGQVVFLNDSFRVGGSSLRFPGDPMGPAAQVIQCRCTQGYVLDD